MKTLVLTGSTKAMRNIHDLTVRSKRTWAEYHEYDFLDIRQWNSEPAVVWQKMALIERMMGEYELVVWLDADTVVTNIAWKAEDFVQREQAVVYVSADWGPCPEEDRWFWFNTGNMVVRWTGMESVRLFEAMWQRGRDKWWNVWGFEQSALQDLKRDPAFGHLISVLPGKMLNAVPRSVQPHTRNPWDHTDFLAHITGITNDHRLQVVQEGFN